jgi:hypothetical protein
MDNAKNQMAMLVPRNLRFVDRSPTQIGREKDKRKRYKRAH